MNGTTRNWRRGFLCAMLAFTPPSLAAGADLGQGWSQDERNTFYYTTQGSRLIRRSWFLALERDDNQDLFLADGLTRFGYLSGTPGTFNPYLLPVGFTVDTPVTKEWIGMTCAACHTSDITYKGMTRRVDGAPAGADMYDFLAKLDLALQKAANDDAAFLRFAARVLGAQNNDANRRKLRDDPVIGLRVFSKDFSQFVINSTPASPWGPARLDAFGMIFNRVTSIDLIHDNTRTPNAPVSYPFLWGTSWHAVTQWNGSMANDSETLRLARNIGQVLGVFGTIDFTRPPLYPSSANKLNLRALEAQVSALKAPVWPSEVFGSIDAKRARHGGDLFLANKCDTCHSIVPPADQLRDAKVVLTPLADIKTDGAMAIMAATRESKTGILEGRPILFSPANRFGATALSFDILRHAVARTLVNPTKAAMNPVAKAQAYELKQLFAPALDVPKYKARPLNGIWATAPYLHNGSVRTLYQLLLPEAQREPKFSVGSREFDPVEVGFISANGPVPFELDTSVDGNRKTGHDYGTSLTHDDRMDLIEYMKGL